MEVFIRLLKGTVGFLIGAAVTVAVGVGLLLVANWIFDTRMVPRGIGWVLGPIAVGVMGWRVGYNFELQGAQMALNERLFSSRRGRMFWACLALWSIAVGVVFFVFDPFDKYRWYAAEWTKFATILLGPAVLWSLRSTYLGGPKMVARRPRQIVIDRHRKATMMKCRVRPQAVMTEADLQAWEALPPNIRLERLQVAVEKGVRSGAADRTMEEILQAVLVRHAQDGL